MFNTGKFFVLLESLQFAQNSDHSNSRKTKQTQERPTEVECASQHFQHNLKLLKKFVKLEYNELVAGLYDALQLQKLVGDLKADPCDEETMYIIYMSHVLYSLINNLNFNSDAKEDLIATKHINLCIGVVQDLSIYALRRQLHSSFYKSNVFKNHQNTKAASNYALLLLSLKLFTKLLDIKQFHIVNAMESVIRDYMAATFSLKFVSEQGGYCNENADLQQQLEFVWRKISKLVYFHNVLLLKATPQLPAQMQQMLHEALMQQLGLKDGYSTLVATLQSIKREDHSDQHIGEIISGIVAQAAHTVRFQQFMIKEVFAFCCRCLNNDVMLKQAMGVGLYTLRRLYDLNSANQQLIKHLLEKTLFSFTNPEDILSGLIVMEHEDLNARINLYYQLFCPSIEAGLPSVLLVDYLPLLMQLHDSLPECDQRQQVGGLIMRCLDNRDVKQELPEIIERLYTSDYKAEWKKLHSRLIIVPLDGQTTRLVMKVAASDYKTEFSISMILPSLLMASTHHTLTYKIFMQLLSSMAKQLAAHTAEPAAIDLLSTEQELADFLNAKYPVKVEILLSLNALVAHPPLKMQLVEHAKDFLKFLNDMLQQRLQANAAKTSSHEETDQTLLILLILLQELLEQCELVESAHDLTPALKQLQVSTPNKLVKQRIVDVLALINGETKPDLADNVKAFETARALIECEDSHLQVYGIQMLLELLRKKDPGTMSQSHLIIALALSTLKNKESYTFLNCVRLFAALVSIMEAEVLEVLADEYLSETTSMDYRLVVGEAILKVGRELGPFCYKYKATLLNCFMHGARSPLEEFRMSAFANLAQICHILTYQVQNFFQELLQLINVELSTGKYVPAKRAAVLVLSELLEGMDNLLDFEEMLLPIYKMLRTIEASESVDDKIRLHAANGLRALNEKCKNFLLPEQHLRKEIQILGIKDKPASSSRQQSILKLN